jgi:hypothetical protein
MPMAHGTMGGGTPNGSTEGRGGLRGCLIDALWDDTRVEAAGDPVVGLRVRARVVAPVPHT